MDVDIALVLHLRIFGSSDLRGTVWADILWAFLYNIFLWIMSCICLLPSRFYETLSAASHLRIFGSSARQIFWNPPRSFASSDLRIFGSPDFLKPSPQLRIFASSRLRLSRFSVNYLTNIMSVTTCFAFPVSPTTTLFFIKEEKTSKIIFYWDWELVNVEM